MQSMKKPLRIKIQKGSLVSKYKAIAKKRNNYTKDQACQSSRDYDLNPLSIRAAYSPVSTIMLSTQVWNKYKNKREELPKIQLYNTSLEKKKMRIVIVNNCSFYYCHENEMKHMRNLLKT